MTADVQPAPDDAAMRPACPFCGAAWTDAMLEHFDSMSTGGPCSCCVGARGLANWPIPLAPDPVAVSDLCCATCGQAIYRKV